jgi:glyoxylase-like metal-dependent hydrolase (beta-lactamase superfamily II)
MFDSEEHCMPRPWALSSRTGPALHLSGAGTLIAMDTRVVELGNGVFAFRYGFFDQTIGLVVGKDGCLVLDTRTLPSQARELQEDVRRITPLPWVVLNTHHHFDHTFGNADFLPALILGHTRCAIALVEHGEGMRERVAANMPDIAGELRDVRIVPPGETFGESDVLDLGGRRVELRHLGLGHTDNDVVAVVPDTGIVFAGDLVEQGAPPSFGDSFPLDWPDTDRRLLELGAGTVVPGHGEVVDRGFVERQRDQLEAAAAAARTAFADGRDTEAAAKRMPFPPASSRVCAERAYAQLAGVPDAG